MGFLGGPPEEGQGNPVFVLLNARGGIDSMGLALMYRLPYDHTILETIAHTSPDHLDGSKMDLGELIFGRVEGPGGTPGASQRGDPGGGGGPPTVAGGEDRPGGPQAHVLPQLCEAERHGELRHPVSDLYGPRRGSSGVEALSARQGWAAPSGEPPFPGTTTTWLPGSVPCRRAPPSWGRSTCTT